MTPSEARQVKPIPPSLKALVPAPVDKIVTIKPQTPDVEGDTMPLIVSKTKRTAYQSKKLAAKLKASSLEETLRNDSNFILNYIAYRLDDPDHEQVRSPRRLIYDGYGDCDCYAVFLGTLLLNQGIDFRFRITQYANSAGEWSHIYVVVPKDQSYKGKLASRDQYYVLDPVTNKHNYEAPFLKKLDITMALQFLDGIGPLRGALGSCVSDGKEVVTPFMLREFVDTEVVIDNGFIPTQQFLESNGWLYEQEVDKDTNTGYFNLITPFGVMRLAPVLSPQEAAQVKELMSLSPTSKVATEQPAKVDNGWVWLLIGIGALAMLPPDPKKAGLGAIPKNIPTLKI